MPETGSMNRALASAVVRSHREHVGRGPTKARSLFRDNVVVVVMQQTLTHDERGMVARGRGNDVLDGRRDSGSAMRAGLIDEIEALTGCKVVAFLNASQIDPDYSADVFVLDRPVPGGAPHSGLGPPL